MKPTRIALFVLSACCIAQASAADAPKRKSGLWEIKMQMAGMPAGQTMQMCVDQASDNMMQERAGKQKPDCPVMDVNRSAGKVTVHSVCKMDGTTVTSDAVMTGDFESNYRSDMTMNYNPPQHGMSTAKMSQEARWLGPCKAGQKPGDVIMQGMPAVNMQNMQKMMDDPQMREMMKQRR